MKHPLQFSTDPEAAADRLLVAAWTAALLVAGIAVNWLAIASAVAGRSFFD